MKAEIRRSMLLFLSLTVFVSFAPDLLAAEKILTILHVNDSHSHLESFGPKNRNLEGAMGGIAKAATVINAEKQSAPDAPLLLHAGDIFTGDIFFNVHGGVPELQLLSEMGFDAMTLGDHEIDLGPDGLLWNLAASFPPLGDPPVIPLPFKILSANLDDSAWCKVGGLACIEKQFGDLIVTEPIIADSMIVERPGITGRPIRIGIFGMTLPGNPAIQSADRIVSIALATANSLRTRGADLVICLSHLGKDTDRMIAQSYVSGIDIIVGGHDHDALMQPISITNSTGGKTFIVQAGEFYKYVGKLSMSVNIPDTGSGPVTIALKDYKLIPVDTFLSADPVIQLSVEKYKAGIYLKYGDVYGDRIGMAPRTGIDKAYNPNGLFRDTGAGNLVTDAFRKHTRADVAITANGFISENLYGGVIVPADVMRMVPYGADPSIGQDGFRLVNVRLTGEQIMKVIEYTLRESTPQEHELQISGMRFTYDPRQPDGDRLVPRTVRMGRRLINARAVYTVVMNEGMVTLMENQIGIIPVSKTVTTDTEYTILKDYISDQRNIRQRSQGRIREKKLLFRFN